MGTFKPSTKQPQQAKVEEEDVDADIIYLLLGFLVQMIWEKFREKKLGGLSKKNPDPVRIVM